MIFGCQSMSAPMTKVLMRRPGDSLRQAKPGDWNYGPAFDPERAIEQYREFAALVEGTEAEITWIEDAGDGLADAMFTRDASFVTPHGVVLLRMGKELRSREPDDHGFVYEENGIPIIGRLYGDALMEGGDMIWLDSRTIAVGCGFRSNREGVRQLGQVLKPYEIEVLGFDLPVWQGEAACLHLMSVISPVDEDMALIHTPLMPAPLYSLLKARGMTLITAPADEFEQSNGLSLNVMPFSPKNCVMIDGFPKTKAALEEYGCTVRTFAGDALCIACEGGPTCLTNPILREAA